MLNEKGDRNDQFSLITVVKKQFSFVYYNKTPISCFSLENKARRMYKTITHLKFKLWCLFT